MPADARELLDGYDSAVDQALSKMGGPPKESDEPVESARPALRSVEDEGDPGDEQVEDATAEEADPVADQARQRVERATAERERISAEVQSRSLARAQRYSDFLDDVENNPAFRDHILKFWPEEQGGAPAAAPQRAAEEEDPLAGYDEKDRNALSKYHDRREQAMLRKIEQLLAPFQSQLVQSAAEREFADLTKEHPDWESLADRKQLRALREQFPNMSLLAAYKLASYDKVRGKISNADRQLATVKDVLSRKAPAESQPRRHVRVEKREMNFDEGFDRAYAQAKAAFGTPGR